MREFNIVDFKADEEIQDFYLVKSSALKKNSNGKTYLDIVIGDSTGEIGCKKWDVSVEEEAKLVQLKEGDIVKIRAVVTLWNGGKQLRISRIRGAVAEDNISIIELIKAAPEDPEEMYSFIFKRAEEMVDEELRGICLHFLGEYREKLLYYPAAQKNHHAEYAGLLYHIKRMLINGDLMCSVYPFLNKDLVATGVILHDMQKINEINSNEIGLSTGYFTEGMLLGHLIQGVKAIHEYSVKNGMNKEKAMMLEHMILSHHYEPEFGSPKRPMFPEAEILHYLDIIDARMFDMEEALSGVEEGEFSDRVWTLDNRRIYKAHI